MHLVPPERKNRRVLDEQRVCKAIDAVGDQRNLAAWAERFAVLGDPNRLALLLCIAHAGPISVTDLATAANMNDTGVSQVLRLLRAAGIVTAHRDGRIMRYELTDPDIGRLLDHVNPLPKGRRRPSA